MNKALLVYGGQALALASNFFANVLVARRLGPAASGEFDIFRQFQIFLVGLCSFGIGTALIYHRRKAILPDSEILHTIRDAASLLVPVFLLISIGAVWFLPGLLRQGTFSFSLFLAIVGSSCLVLLGFARAFWIATSNISRVFLIDCLSPILFLGSIFLAVPPDSSADAAAVFFCWGVSLMLPGLVLCGWIWKSAAGAEFNIRAPLKFAAFGGRALISNLFYLALLNVLYLMFRKKGMALSELGILTRSLALMSVFLMPISAISPFIFARWSGVEEGNHRGRMLRWSAASFSYFGCLAVLVYIWGGKLITVLYGPKFEAMEALLLPIVAIGFLAALYSGVQNIFSSTGQPGRTIPALVAANLAIVLITVFSDLSITAINGCLVLLCAYGFLLLACMVDFLASNGLRRQHLMQVDDKPTAQASIG